MEALDQMMGFLQVYEPWSLLISIVIVLTIGFIGVPVIIWVMVFGTILMGFAAPKWLFLVYLVIAIPSIITPIRKVFSGVLLKVFNSLGLVPKISETERQALDAGVVWVEADLFSGKPDFKKMLQEPGGKLTEEEQKFLDTTCEQVCAMTDDWLVQSNRELPEKVWEFIKKEKFLGMIIPKEYGGLGFSAFAHSAVIKKLSSKSIPLTISVMVPNSLGPAELLLHYGTEKQKNEILPKLANGDYLPCFALTEPTAGSDAASISSHGTVFKGEDGKLYIKLNWNKRWITLAAIANILGLAFRLYDPENHLGKGEDIGITCALVPSETEGVVLGKRHDPLGVPFYNCPMQGKDVIVPIDAIIGGVDYAGKGWGMLMDSLAAGRGISLPGQSTGGTQQVALGASGHSKVRKQFGMNIGMFEGIEDPLGHIAGWSYILESQRRLTCGGLDKGVKPPVVTAMMKYSTTELGRKAINHGMDIVAGQAISRGKRNYLANSYCGLPIGITVEGANILTRTLIVFGQGALRAHPYMYKMVKALEGNDVDAFDKALWGFKGNSVRNLFRSVLLSITRGNLASSPVSGITAKYYKKLAWVSASFATMADITMLSQGPALKARGKVSGRFADILSWMYLAFSVLHRYENEGCKKEDFVFVKFAMDYAFKEIQIAFDGIFSNLPLNGPFLPLKLLLRGPIRFWSGLNSLSSGVGDDTTHKIAQLMQQDTEQRRRLLYDGIYVTEDMEDPIGRINETFKMVIKAEPIEKKIKKAMRKKTLTKGRILDAISEAVEKSVITVEEGELLRKSEAMRLDCVQVDDFGPEEYFRKPQQKY